MKVTVVPAQVTTVEDRIMGSLSFSQMMLVIAPIFVCAGLYGLLPPAMGSSSYKFVVMGVIAVTSCILAIRIRGKILALWLITILRFKLRPKYYLFNKNVVAHRKTYPQVSHHSKNRPEPTTAKIGRATPRLGLPETAKVLAAIENPAAKFRFETTKKGGLYVRLTEVED